MVCVPVRKKVEFYIDFWLCPSLSLSLVEKIWEFFKIQTLKNLTLSLGLFIPCPKISCMPIPLCKFKKSFCRISGSVILSFCFWGKMSKKFWKSKTITWKPILKDSNCFNYRPSKRFQNGSKIKRRRSYIKEWPKYLLEVSSHLESAKNFKNEKMWFVIENDKYRWVYTFFWWVYT